MMRHARILMVFLCLGFFIPAIHAEGPRPAPAAPQSEDPICWRVSPECVSSSIRWGEKMDRKFYVDVTNVCTDILYMAVCLEILRPDGDENVTCEQFALPPMETHAVEAWNVEEPTERYDIKAFGVKHSQYGQYTRCQALVPGFQADNPF